ncbi:MAG: pyridoxal phosphate-dependent aminotransferase [Oscillospiraceae bacterium]|nr:pyridoxal phosphate-dependent aminotransferase [Oscillospiraceae bacterium]
MIEALSARSLAWGRTENNIRALAGYAAARKAEIGRENVFDFSIGNPSVPPPPCVNEAFRALLEETDPVELHAYTPAPGLPSLRRAIARQLSEKSGTDFDWRQVYVTMGASAGLAAFCRAVLLPGEKAVAFAPFFMEYRVFAEAAGGALVTVPPREDMQPDLGALTSVLDEKVKLVILNSPNNPSGAVLTEESLRRISALLSDAERRYGHPVYLLADEPYRELLFDGRRPLCAADYYDDTVICYSYSKSLSLPGERLGYLAVSSRVRDREAVFDAIAGAARGCGYINAPSLIQRVVERCLDATADLDVYARNREALYGGLRELGFTCVYPDGAFYLFVKSPIPDAVAFSERAKRYELILVPSDDFGVPGYLRLAYCVPREMIDRSMGAFAALAREFGLKKE